MSVSKESLDKAIVAHAQWKFKIRAALDTGKTEVNPIHAGKDNECEFGKWLYSLPPSDQANPHFQEVRKLHAEFHRLAARCITMATTGQKLVVEKSLHPGGDFSIATTGLTKAVMNWKSSL